MRKFGIALLALVALTACGEAKQGFDDGFNTKFHENFVSSCIGSATKAGAATELATTLCNCASEKVKERFTVQQKMTLKNEKLLPIVEECRKANPA